MISIKGDEATLKFTTVSRAIVVLKRGDAVKLVYIAKAGNEWKVTKIETKTVAQRMANVKIVGLNVSANYETSRSSAYPKPCSYPK